MTKNKLLDSKLITQYNYPLMSKEVRKMMSTLALLKLKYENVSFPVITSRYEIRYGIFARNNDSKIEDYVVKKLTNEENLNKYIVKFVTAMQKLNHEERLVFIESFGNECFDDNICLMIGCCRDMVLKIRKSAVIKFLTCYGKSDEFLL